MLSIPGFTIKISAWDGTFLDGFNAISIGENGTETSTPMSGTQHNITFEEGSVEQWIEFTGIQSLNLVLAPSFEMIYDDGSPSDTIQIMDIMHENWMVNAEPEFEIDVQGRLTADEWENYGCKITGAEIMVSGSIDMDKCELIQSTPIIAENSASVKFGQTDSTTLEMTIMLLLESTLILTLMEMVQTRRKSEVRWLISGNAN